MNKESFKDQRWHVHHQKGNHPHFGRRRQRFLFFRLLLVFGFIASFFFAGVGGTALLFRRIVQDPNSSNSILWLAGCTVPMLLIMATGWMGVGAFRRVARPLADVMAAADAVAEGNFSVRVSEKGPNDFNKLARSFNRMTSQLEISDEQRRNLTADVAHELRTPLHIIQGNLEGILDGVYQPTPEHIQDTLEETQLLARLVEDLRTLSLAESGHLPLHQEPLAMSVLLDDLETSFAGQAATAEIDLRFELVEERPLLIQGDADRLNQALSNLIINAIRHTPVGGHILVAAKRENNQAIISITDSGDGIGEKELPFVFDRFWKADKSRTGSGSGLGLAITKQLIVAHGGDITVESQLGEGATFTILLPIFATD